MTFSFNFLHAATFLHVLHLDVLRGQIEIESESKNEYFLMYGYNAGPPMAIPPHWTLLGVYICVTSSGNVSPYNPLHIIIRAVDHAMHLAHICDCCGSGCGAQNCAFNVRPSKVDSQFAVRLLLMAHVSFFKFVMRSSEMMDRIHAQNNTCCEIHDVKIFPPQIWQ